MLYIIVGNAVKFTNFGGIDIHIYNTENLALNQKKVIIEVEDTGIGIEKEQ